MKESKFLSHGSPYFRFSIKTGAFILDTRKEEKKKKNTFYLLTCEYM